MLSRQEYERMRRLMAPEHEPGMRTFSFLVVVGVLLILLAPTGVGLGSSQTSPVAGAPSSTGFNPSTAAGQLQAASGSLELGQGPGRAGILQCHGFGVTVDCQSTGAAAPHPLGSSAANNTSWIDMTPQLPSAPVPMYLAMMTYDYHDGYVVFFGGYSSGGQVLSQTWIFKGGAWSQLSATGPGAAYVGTMAYDFADHYVLLFGGYSGSIYYNDTWTFSNGTWTELFPATSPSARWRQAMAWDGTDDRIVLYGGTTASVDLGDTWTFVHGTWTNVTKSVTGHPPPTFRGSMAWDGSDGYDILFGGVMVGGFGGGSGSNYTWAYANLTWRNLTKSAGKAPSPRVYEAMVWDNATDSIVLFGGAATDTGGVSNDTWYFHNGTWRDQTKNLSRTPNARAFEMMTYVPTGQFALLFGGYDESSYYNDTWGLGAPVLAALSVTPGEIDLGQGIVISANAFSNYRPLAFSYANLPKGCSGGNVTEIRCTPTNSGTFNITLSVNDTKGYQSRQYALAVVATPPLLTGFVASKSPVTEDQPTVLQVTVQGGGPPLSYSYSKLPFGCLSADTANLTCRPARTGAFTVDVSVTDYFGYVVNGSTSLVVVTPGKVAEFVATPDTLDVNTTTVFTVQTVNGTSPYAYAYSGLPAGCASADTPDLSCTPLAANTSTVTVTVTDSSGSRFSATESVFVNPDLSILSFNASVTSLDVGQSVTFTVLPSGGSGVNVWTYQGLPTGCSFVGGTVNHCTPSAAGNFSVTVSGTDSVNWSANATVNLSVQPLPSASIRSQPGATDVFLPFAITTVVRGGFPPYQYAYSGLPTNCGAPTVATFTCTPETPNRLAISVEITDSVGGRSSHDLLNVTVNGLPTITGAITNPSTPRVDESTDFNITIQGGTGVYDVAYSGLPPGCTSSNSSTLVCTPTSVGSYQVSVVVVDSVGGRASGSGWFNVSAAPTSASGLFGLPGNDGLFVIVGAGIAVLVAVAIGLFVMRRRRSPPRTPDPIEDGGSEEMAPSGEAGHYEP